MKHITAVFVTLCLIFVTGCSKNKVSETDLIGVWEADFKHHHIKVSPSDRTTCIFAEDGSSIDNKKISRLIKIRNDLLAKAEKEYEYDPALDEKLILEIKNKDQCKYSEKYDDNIKSFKSVYQDSIQTIKVLHPSGAKELEFDFGRKIKNLSKGKMETELKYVLKKISLNNEAEDEFFDCNSVAVTINDIFKKVY